jgi:hypothetical protein
MRRAAGDVAAMLYPAQRSTSSCPTKPWARTSIRTPSAGRPLMYAVGAIEILAGIIVAIKPLPLWSRRPPQPWRGCAWPRMFSHTTLRVGDT